MGKHFDISDFELFDTYGGKSRKVSPEGFGQLRKMYYKLGEISDILKARGYKCSIFRKVTNQSQAESYSTYHWAQVYPKDQKLANECNDKVFFVVGCKGEGFEIHLDSRQYKGYKDTDTSKEIKNRTWKIYSPEEASQYSKEELADRVEVYINEHMGDFHRFAREFGIQESINILNDMELNEIVSLLRSNYNLILTGAPGTGKTYLAKKIAEKLGATEKTIKMVQFHQSYDYTDFVEGLRPVMSDDGVGIGFEHRDGVFKSFCAEALENYNNSQPQSPEIRSFEARLKSAYGKLVGDIASGTVKAIPLKSAGSSIDVTGISSRGNIILKAEGSTTENKYTISYNRLQKLSLEYRDKKSLDNLTNIYEGVKAAIGGCNTSAFWAVLRFIYDKYFDGVEVEAVEPEQLNTYVFIIDEINRGEMSKIFGELFFAIDPGYRGEKGKIDTQYQNLLEGTGDIFEGGFYVPKNVYIIGTMNDIDRSVESIDFAMRRRFAWREITAKERQGMLDEAEAWDGADKMPPSDVIERIKNRMDNLNAAIEGEEVGLSKEYHIGASYFLKYALYNDFDKLWDNHLKGLLYEYLRGTSGIAKKIEILMNAYNNEAKN